MDQKTNAAFKADVAALPFAFFACASKQATLDPLMLCLLLFAAVPHMVGASKHWRCGRPGNRRFGGRATRRKGDH